MPRRKNPVNVYEYDEIAFVEMFNDLIALANARGARGDIYRGASLWDYEPFPSPVALVLDDEMALAGRGDDKRACAAATVDDKNHGHVFVARKLLEPPFGGPSREDRQRGVLAHELAHVSLLQHGDEEHSERACDEHAKRLFGITIRYDSDDVQTTGAGLSPRPAYLG